MMLATVQAGIACASPPAARTNATDTARIHQRGDRAHPDTTITCGSPSILRSSGRWCRVAPDRSARRGASSTARDARRIQQAFLAGNGRVTRLAPAAAGVKCVPPRMAPRTDRSTRSVLDLAILAGALLHVGTLLVFVHAVRVDPGAADFVDTFRGFSRTARAILLPVGVCTSVLILVALVRE